MEQLHHLLSQQSLARHSFAGLPMSVTDKMLASIADSVNFLIFVPRIIGASCPLRLCCCTDVDDLLWTALLYSTNTPTDSRALTTVRWRSFRVLTLHKMLGLSVPCLSTIKINICYFSGGRSTLCFSISKL